jgi:hypothetical protein
MWECGDCGMPESSTRKLDQVCHHCGLLLCRECRHTIVDTAFGGPLVSPQRSASHCRACRWEHHAAAVPLGGGTGG